MSMTMITTAVVLASAASVEASSGGVDCPLSDFGGYCLLTFGVMMILAVVSLILGATAGYTSKRFEWGIGSSIVLLIGSMIPIMVGMIHDCP